MEAIGALALGAKALGLRSRICCRVSDTKLVNCTTFKQSLHMHAPSQKMPAHKQAIVNHSHWFATLWQRTSNAFDQDAYLRRSTHSRASGSETSCSCTSWYRQDLRWIQMSRLPRHRRPRLRPLPALLEPVGQLPTPMFRRRSCQDSTTLGTICLPRRWRSRQHSWSSGCPPAGHPQWPSHHHWCCQAPCVVISCLRHSVGVRESALRIQGF